MSYDCCSDWRVQIDKVNAPLILQTIRSGYTYKYDGIPFRYCPWCGKDRTSFQNQDGICQREGCTLNHVQDSRFCLEHDLEYIANIPMEEAPDVDDDPDHPPYRTTSTTHSPHE